MDTVGSGRGRVTQTIWTSVGVIPDGRCGKRVDIPWGSGRAVAVRRVRWAWHKGLMLELLGLLGVDVSLIDNFGRATVSVGGTSLRWRLVVADTLSR